MAGSHHARAAAAGWRRPGYPVVFAAALALTTAVGGLTIPAGSQLALVWPAAGFGILWLCATRSRQGLLTAVAALPVLVAAVNLLTGSPPHLAGVFAGSSVAQAVVGWCLVDSRRRPRRPRRHAGSRGAGETRHDGGGCWQLATTRDLWWLLLVAAVSSVASAAVLWVGHVLTGFGPASPVRFVELFVRNATGVIVLVAPVLRLLGGTRPAVRPVAHAGTVERTVMAVSFVVLYAAVFWVNPGLPLAFIVLPLSAWMALRLPTTAVTMSVAVIAVAMTVSTMAGRGVFGHLPTDTGILVSQAFIALIGVLSTLLALHRDERDALLRRVAQSAGHTKQQSALLKAVFGAVPHGLSVVDRTGRPLMANRAVRDLMGAPPIAQGSVLDRGYDLYHPDGRPLRTDELPLARALRGTDVDGMDLMVKTTAHPQGRLLSTTAHRLPDTGDEPWSGGVVLAFHDITEARRAADEVSAAHDLLAGVLDGATQQAIIGTDMHGRITVFNVGAEEMLGWTRDEAIGRTPEFLHERAEVAARARELGLEPGFGVFVDVASRSNHETRQWTYVRRDGTRLQVMLTVTALRSVHGRVSGFISVAQDITDRLHAEQRLADSEQMLRLSFETAPTAIAVISLYDAFGTGAGSAAVGGAFHPSTASGRILRSNRALAEFTGHVAAPLLDTPFADLVYPEDRERYEAALARLFTAADERTRCELRFVHTDGGTRWGALSAAVVRPGAPGQAPFLMCLVEDVTARRQAEEHLAYQATHDALTGLVNRQAVGQLLQRALDDASFASQVGVLYLDLDGFKAVNDLAGHDAGDEVLRQVATRLRQCTRAQDVVGRLGGDEFAVVCPGLTDARELQRIAERIVLAVAHPICVDACLHSVGASIGSVVAQEPGPADEVLRRADQAMYAAKRAGKNRVVSLPQV